MTKISFFGVFSAILFMGNALSQDCSKLQPFDLGFLGNARHISGDNRFECKDNFELVVSHQFGELLPLRRISISKKDFKESVTFEENILRVNGEKFNASQVALYEPICVLQTREGEKYEYDRRLTVLGCKNELVSFSVEGRTEFNQVFKEFSKINSPIFKKSEASCQEKAKSLISKEVQKFVKQNGGNLISIKRSKPITEATYNEDGLLSWMSYDVEIMKDKKKVKLSLKYPLLDNSDLKYDSRNLDSFGEMIPYSERSAVLKLKVSGLPLTIPWYDSYIGDHQKVNGSTAMLTNPNTKTKLLEIDFSNFSCVDEIVINQSSNGPEVSNTSSRDNPKDDIGIGNKKKSGTKNQKTSAQ